jgi:hypothetical protein
MTALPPPPQWSPDGEWWWNGIGWEPRWNPSIRTNANTTTRSKGISLAVVLSIVVVVYVVYHAYRYHECVVFPPGIFEWPTACV